LLAAQNTAAQRATNWLLFGRVRRKYIISLIGLMLRARTDEAKLTHTFKQNCSSAMNFVVEDIKPMSSESFFRPKVIAALMFWSGSRTVIDEWPSKSSTAISL